MTLARAVSAALAVATGLAIGSVACNRSRPTEPTGSAVTAAGPGWFEDVTDAVGLNFTFDCGPTDTYFMPQSMYGGAALFDADGDGRPGIPRLQGGRPNTGAGDAAYLAN